MIQAGNWVAVCDAASGELRWEMHRPDGLSGLAWLPRLQALAMGTGRDSVVLFSAEDGSALGPAGVPIHTTESLAASRLGDRLAVSTERFGTRVYEVEGGRLLGTDPCGAWHLHFSGDGNRVGTLMEDGRPAWVEILGSRVLRRVDTGPVPPDSVLAFTAGGEELMVLARDGVQFWRVADGRRLGGVLVRKAVGAVLAEQGRRLYLTRGSDLLGVDLGALGEGTVEAAALMQLLQGQRFWGVAAGARRGRIAVADLAGNRVRILNPAGTLEREFEPFVAPGYVAFSPDERWLACGGGTNAGVWDLEAATAAPVRLFRGEGERVRFSPSGRWLIGEGRDLRLWRTGTWEAEEVVPLASSNTQGFAAAVSPDDHWLAATQQDREIQLVDVSRRVVVAVLEGPGEGRVSRLEFSPDGTRLAATRDRGEVQVWDLVALREELARRNLAW